MMRVERRLAGTVKETISGSCSVSESMTDDGESCLGGEALSPDIGGEAPADFDAWGEMRFE